MSWSEKFKEYRNDDKPTVYDHLLFDMENAIEEERAHSKFAWFIMTIIVYIALIISNII